ncbi:hypothetical protein CL634_11375 [bacterium]|jgi:hypothetical protein|nr:hypothetical protein [bacterium]|tara:strand:- start:332 stop:781 length:450 start_codon:yes stop_codon:yes gene_type:complete
MSDLIPERDKTTLKAAYADFFDTFKRSITVHKQAKRVIDQINTSFLFGYGEPSQQVNYAYETESKVFSAIVWYPRQANQDFEISGEIRAFIPEGEIRIKVGKDAKEYLVAGRSIERIDIEDHSYELISEDAEINHFFSDYYIFKLKETK